ncbi:MAG: hypothetical protein ACE5FZ_08020 [Nitrospiria bacterium]
MKKKLVNLIVVLGVLFVPGMEAYGAEWTLFGRDNLFEHYYDKENLKTTPEKIVQVIIKVVPKGKKGKDLLLGVRDKAMFLMGGYEDYAHTVTAVEINCPEKLKAVLESSDFDHKGNVLDTVRDPLATLRRDWTRIGPDSYPYSDYHKVFCKK